MRQPIVKGAKQIYAKLDKPFWSATPPRGFPEVQFEDAVIQTEVAKPFFAKMRVLSAGKAGISVLGAKVVGLIAREAKASQISFSQDGSLLAAFEPFEIALYNLSDGTRLRTVAVSEHREDAPLNWVGKYLLVGSVVYDVDRGLPLWTYEGEPTSRSTVGAYLVCGFGGEKASNLTIQRVPHSAALAEAAKVDPANIYAIRPGDAVMVDYRFNTTPADVQAEIRRVVEAKINHLGWKLSSDAPNSLLVEMEQGQSDIAEYYSRKGFGPFLPPPMFGPRPSGPMETVSFTPWTHKITITADGSQVYQATHVRGAPDGLQTKEGESTQAAVTKHCQPSPGYFEHLPIPPHLQKPEFQGGLGKSKLAASGMQ